MKKNKQEKQEGSGNRKLVLLVFIAAALIIGAILYVGKSGSVTGGTTSVQNVTMENGKQIVSINVKGGYSPRVSTAKAGIPTILRFTTNGSFDCSSTLVLPSVGYRSTLPLSGITDIELPAQAVGTFKGMCGMGMYNFSINFS